jgi:hypothetical protein
MEKYLELTKKLMSLIVIIREYLKSCWKFIGKQEAYFLLIKGKQLSKHRYSLAIHASDPSFPSMKQKYVIKSNKRNLDHGIVTLIVRYGTY